MIDKFSCMCLMSLVFVKFIWYNYFWGINNYVLLLLCVYDLKICLSGMDDINFLLVVLNVLFFLECSCNIIY